MVLHAVGRQIFTFLGFYAGFDETFNAVLRRCVVGARPAWSVRVLALFCGFVGAADSGHVMLLYCVSEVIVGCEFRGVHLDMRTVFARRLLGFFPASGFELEVPGVASGS